MAQNSRKRVIATRFSALGDVAMTIPALYSACADNPDTDFTLITRKSMAGMFVNVPANLQVLGIDLNGEYNSPLKLWRLASKLIAEQKPDAWVDLHDVLRTKLMRLCARLHGVRVSHINKGRSEKRRLTRKKNKVMQPLTSSIERYAQALHDAGIDFSLSFTSLYGKGQKAAPELYSSITGPKPADQTWIGIAPFAAHAGKVYPTELMDRVIEMLNRKKHIRIFIFGAGQQEAEQAARWAEKYPAVTSLASERHGFAAELALLSNLDAVLTMDSANMHLAAIAGAPTVSIWGATHSYCGFMGWGQTQDDIVQTQLPCRPCSVFGDKPCMRGDLLCLRSIAPDNVVSKIYSKLPNRQ